MPPRPSAALNLGSLAHNGGPTDTIAITSASAAFNAGDYAAAASLITDQRGPGFPRTTGMNVDVGAFEVEGQAPSITNGPATATATVGSSYAFSYQATGLPTPTFTLLAGSTLPSGLTLSSSGVLSGTDNTAADAGQTFTGTIDAGNGIGADAMQAYSIVVSSAPVGSPQLSDPGFETPVVGTGAYGDFEYDPSGSPWTFTNATGVAGNGSGFTSGNPNAPQGTQVGLLQGVGGTISQSIEMAAGSYVVTFDAAQRGAGNHGGEDVEVLVDGVNEGLLIPASSSYALYSSMIFSVTAGEHTIEFLGVDPSGLDNTAFIDQVSVQSAPPYADPGFETPNVGTGAYGDFEYDPSGSPWTFTGGAVAGNGSGFTSANSNAPQGTQVAVLQGGGSTAVSQTVTWAAGSYLVMFSAAQRGSGNNGGEEIEVLIDGVVVGTIDPASSSYATYSTGVFTVGAGSHTLTFQGVDPNSEDNSALIDQVAVVSTASLGDSGFETPTVGTGARRRFQARPAGHALDIHRHGGRGRQRQQHHQFQSARPGRGPGRLPAKRRRHDQPDGHPDGGAATRSHSRRPRGPAPALTAARRSRSWSTARTRASTPRPARRTAPSAALPSRSPPAATPSLWRASTPAGSRTPRSSTQCRSSARRPCPIRASRRPTSAPAPTAISSTTRTARRGRLPAMPAWRATAAVLPAAIRTLRWGPQVGLVQGGGPTISQSLTLAAGSYYISFTAAQRGNGGNHGGEEVEVEIDGQDAGTITPAGTSYAVYNSTVFTVGAGSHTIALVGVDPNSQDNTAFITQVAVVSTTSLADPNFQTPVVGAGAAADYKADPSGSPWTFTGTAGVAGNGSGFTSANPPAPVGTQVGFLQGAGSSLSQSVVLAAGTYVLSFQAAQRGSGNHGGQEIEVLVDGNVEGMITPVGTAYATYASNVFVVGAGPHTIKLFGLDPGGLDNTALIDQVTISPL